MTKDLNYTENYNTNQLVLPLDFEYLLPKDSEVFTYLDLMKGIDLKKYFESPKTKGRIRKNRVQILNTILFGFMVGYRSLREIEKACINDIRFKFLMGGTEGPSHTTINKVGKEIENEIDYLILEINKEIMKREKIHTKLLYIDGTKIEADANKYNFVWGRSVKKNQEKLYLKITKAYPILNKILNENGYKGKVPKEKYKGNELEKIKKKLFGIMEHCNIVCVYGKGKRKTEIQRLYDAFTEYTDKMYEYEEHLRIIGPKRSSYAKTDHDATYMHMKEDHMRNSQLKAGYNVQIGVSNEYIMVCELFQYGADQKTFQPLLEKYNVMYDEYPLYPVADAGYGSFDNYKYCQSKGMKLYQKYGMWAKERDPKFKKLIYNKENFKIDKNGKYRCPNNKKFLEIRRYQSTRIESEHEMIEYECLDCMKCRHKSKCTQAKENRKITFINGYKELKDEVNENLDSRLGIYLRTQRSIQVEGAFGVIKQDMRFRRFTRTGFKGVRLEMNLIVIGYNLKKFHNKKYR